jgi:hypothetical protein
VTLAPVSCLRASRDAGEDRGCAAGRFRHRCVDDRIEIDFPKSKPNAKQEVIFTLDAISPAVAARLCDLPVSAPGEN